MKNIILTHTINNATKVLFFHMKNILHSWKTLTMIAFLYSFSIYSQQSVIEPEDWGGDISNFDIKENIVKCNSNDESVIYLERKDTIGTEWYMEINMTNVDNGRLVIYPMASNINNLENEESFNISKNEKNIALEYEGLSILIQDLLNSPDKINIELMLTDKKAWEIKIDGNKIVTEEDLKSSARTSSCFALKFKNMQNSEIKNLSITPPEKPTDPDNPPTDPDDPEPPQKEEGSKGLKYGDIVFNEIMANPKGAAGLPEVEYIELYNRTDSTLQLKDWILSYGESRYKITYGEIAAKDYIILSKESNAQLWDEAEIYKRTDMPRFPILANSGKKLFLYDAGGELVAYTHYTEERYHNNFKSKGGFSIERIDADNINDAAMNWTATNSLQGGTPAQANTVAAECKDREAASFLHSETISADIIRLHFNAPLNIASATDENNYNLAGEGPKIYKIYCDTTYHSFVDLHFSPELKEHDRLRLEMNNIKQVDGTEIMLPEAIELMLPHEATEKELVFNEILFDSRNTCEYVELYNLTDHTITTANLSFATIGKEGQYDKTSQLCSTNMDIPPHSYHVFTRDTTTLRKTWGTKAWQSTLCNLPSLKNEGSTIAIINQSAEEIDVAIFTPAIYPSTGHGSSDTASEKVNPQLASNNTSNWLPATAQSNYGTPGKENSQYTPLENEPKNNRFTLQDDFMTPDNDGQNDYAIINYTMENGGYIANIKIFDSKGREVARPVNREILSTEGSLIWNGEDSQGNILKPGIYIIYVEAHNENGDRVKQKLAIAIN